MTPPVFRPQYCLDDATQTLTDLDLQRCASVAPYEISRMVARSTKRALRTPTQFLRFTKARLTALKPPVKGRRYVRDEGQPGLTICVTRSGVKTFYCNRRINGRPTRLYIGRFPDISVDQARKLAADYLGDIARGKNPQERKRELLSQATLRETYDRFMEWEAPKLRERTTVRNYRSIYENHLRQWARHRLSDITLEDVRALHARLGRRTPIQANRVVAFLRELFNYAGRPNPCKGIKRFDEHGRERYLDGEELKRLFVALKDESELFQHFFLVLLLTGARRSNVQAMRWKQLDLKRGIWRISRDLSKSRKPVDVVLAPEVVAILGERNKGVDGDFVFPGNGRTGHLVEPKKAWKRVLDAAEIQDCRIHDIRHTLAAWQAGAGASLLIIGKSLGHKSTRSTERYAHLDLEPVRKSVTTATQAMLVAADGTAILNGGGDDD